MKGIIRENLGESRYVVGVPLAVQPLADEIEKYTKLYQATIPKITDAFKTLAEARDGYALLLAAVTNAAADYELCRMDFSPTTCIEAGQTACNNAYNAAIRICEDIESGIGECDPDCQRERERCAALAANTRDACLAVVELDCAELQYSHIQECQETHSPLIAQAQAAALEKLPAIQEALYNLQTEQAIQFSLARKLNELEGIAAREYQITCFKAQYDAELAVGTEVEMAKTPNGRHAITGIITAPTPCLHDSRVLPSGHLFVNSALYPGFETWRPTWRVGTVQEVIPPDLKILFAPANLAGSLGTLYSENPIDCTPPQSYFDGKDPKTAEADIVTARDALADAQQVLLDAVKVQNDCIAEFDQAWMDQCYGTAVEVCDQSYSASIEPALQDRATCYEDGPANCEESVAAGLEACDAAFRPAIDEKQAAVDAAQLVVTETAQDLVDAQQSLAAIKAEIQVCVNAINDPAWPADHPGADPEAAIAACRSDRQGDLDAAEAAIDAAYYPAMQAELVLGQAEDALAEAEQALADCNGQWDLAACIASAIAICDDTYTQATEYYILAKAACYEEAMRVCDEQRDTAIQACRDDNAAAIEAAQLVVDAAVREVEIATNGRYHPADPLTLNVPVEHCSAENYQVGDEVLIDFPIRSGAAMAVWDSRRVIGWATETRTCQPPAWPPRVEIHILCNVAAAASRRATTVLGQPDYTCPVEGDDISYYTVWAYNSSLFGEFVWDSFTYPGMAAIPQAGISASANYTDGENALVGTNSYIIRSMPAPGVVAYLDRYECSLAHCASTPFIDYLENYWGIRIYHGTNDLTRLTTYADIVAHLGIPVTATLTHLETGATKTYTIDPDSYGSTGHGLPENPGNFSGAIVISYRPPPEA